MTVVIPASPPAPQASDPVNFESKADALLAALPGIIATMNTQNAENNTIHAGMQDAAYAAAAAAVQAVGTAGPPGAPGTPGAPGATPTITIGTVSTVAAGAPASASVTQAGTSVTLNLTLPRGDTSRVSFKYQATAGQTSFVANYTPGFVDFFLNGVKLAEVLDFTATSGTACVLTSGAAAGDVVEIIASAAFDVADTYTRTQIEGLIDAAAAGGGLGGTATGATVDIGTVTTGAAGSSATVTNSGTPSAAVLNFTIPQGASGAPGTPGTPGTAATVSIGTVTTGAAGTNATVTNSGTPSAAVLNFTIPRGTDGAAATGGGGAGALVLLGTINAAASASVDITPIDTWAATYDSLLIVGSGISVSGSSAQTISAALKIGGTWLTSGYSFGASYFAHYSPQWMNTGSQSAPSILLGNTRGAQETGSAVPHLASLNMDVLNLGGCASLRCTLDGTVYVGNIVTGITTQGYGRSTSQLGALQGIRLISSAASAQGAAAPAAGGVVGTITGAFRVYGRVKA